MVTKASLDDEIRQRFPWPARVVAAGLAGLFVWLAVDVALGDGAVWVRVVVGIVAAEQLAACVVFVRMELVAGGSSVSLRGIRTHRFGWDDVRTIEPSHHGLVFELTDGRGLLVARSTAKSGLAFLPVRYDRELLEALRARVPR